MKPNTFIFKGFPYCMIELLKVRPVEYKEFSLANIHELKALRKYLEFWKYTWILGLIVEYNNSKLKRVFNYILKKDEKDRFGDSLDD